MCILANHITSQSHFKCTTWISSLTSQNISLGASNLKEYADILLDILSWPDFTGRQSFFSNIFLEGSTTKSHSYLYWNCCGRMLNMLERIFVRDLIYWNKDNGKWLINTSPSIVISSQQIIFSNNEIGL